MTDFEILQLPLFITTKEGTWIASTKEAKRWAGTHVLLLLVQNVVLGGEYYRNGIFSVDIPLRVD